MLQPIAVRRKFYLIFASEDFSIEIIIYKKISVNYKTSGGKKKARVLAEIKRTSALT